MFPARRKKAMPIPFVSKGFRSMFVTFGTEMMPKAFVFNGFQQCKIWEMQKSTKPMFSQAFCAFVKERKSIARTLWIPRKSFPNPCLLKVFSNAKSGKCKSAKSRCFQRLYAFSARSKKVLPKPFVLKVFGYIV